jgi:hypothetical protein
MSLSFNLPYDSIGISLIMDTQADQINYSASLVEAVDDSTPPDTPSSASRIGVIGVGAAVQMVVVLVYLLQIW